jgi:putative DNA primase/helicase
MSNIIYLSGPNGEGTATKTDDADQVMKNDPIPATVTNNLQSDSTLPSGFAMFHDGIYLMPTDDEAFPPVPICSPIRVDSSFVGEDGKGWGKIISVKDSDGIWQDVQVTNKELVNSSAVVLGRLIDSGLELAVNKKAKEHLFAFLKQCKPFARMIAVSRLGWVGDGHTAFNMPDGAIGSDSIVSISSKAGLASNLTRKGTPEGWKKAIGEKCRDNPMMILAVSLAFSGPLLAILGLASGGLHFRGSSSSGKSTLLGIAASVWGSPGLVAQWRATGNGLEGIASTG